MSTLAVFCLPQEWRSRPKSLRRGGAEVGAPWLNRAWSTSVRLLSHRLDSREVLSLPGFIEAFTMTEGLNTVFNQSEMTVLIEPLNPSQGV